MTATAWVISQYNVQCNLIHTNFDKYVLFDYFCKHISFYFFVNLSICIHAIADPFKSILTAIHMKEHKCRMQKSYFLIKENIWCKSLGLLYRSGC